MVGIDGEKAPSLGRGAGGCGAGVLSWAAGRRGAGARGAGNQFNWAEREAAPHPRAGARRGDTGDAGLVGSGLARLPAPVLLRFPAPRPGTDGPCPFGLPEKRLQLLEPLMGIGGDRPATSHAGARRPLSVMQFVLSPSSVSQTTSLLLRTLS